MHWSLNVQIGTMMEQPVQHLRRLARGCGDDGGMKRRVAIRDMAVEGDGRLRALVRIDRTGRLGTASEREVLTIRTGRCPGHKQGGEGRGVLGTDQPGESPPVGFLAYMQSGGEALREGRR